MTLRYSDALDMALDAVRAGENLEAVLGLLPAHAARLREDLRLGEAVRRAGNSLPEPAATARANASTRLTTQLQTSRRDAAGAQRGRRRFGIGLPRFALAAALVVAALLGLGLLSNGGSGSVEAATIEGVVLENDNGSLTVQTLDALEEVTVPAGAPVADAAGASIDLGGISAGQVVSIQVQRRNGAVVAQRVERRVDNIEAWCSGESQRCQQLADQLEQAETRCNAQPASCRAILQQINTLRERAADVASLSDLRARCGSDKARACQQLGDFCGQHSLLCGDLVPPIPSGDAGESLRLLLESCRQGQASACRQLIQACAGNSACPQRATPTLSSSN